MEDNKKNKIQKPRLMLTIFGAAALSILFYFLIGKFDVLLDGINAFMKIIRPFILGIAMAYVVCPLCKWLEKVFGKWFALKKKPEGKRRNIIKWLSITISMLVLAGAIYALIIMIIPQLYRSIANLCSIAPDKIEATVLKLEAALVDHPDMLEWVKTTYTSVSENFTDWVTSKILPSFGNVVSGVGSGVVSVVVFLKDFIVGYIVAFYCLGSRATFKVQGKKIIYAIFNKKSAEVILDEFAFADKKFTAFLSGNILDALIIGVCSYIFCLIADTPSALLVSALAFITNIIPFFGPIIGGVVIGFLLIIQSPTKCLVYLIFFVVLQQVDSNIIKTKIFGDTTGLPGFWVLFSITLFGGLFGFVGMLIGVPCFAVIYDIASKLINMGVKKHEAQNEICDTKG